MTKGQARVAQQLGEGLIDGELARSSLRGDRVYFVRGVGHLEISLFGEICKACPRGPAGMVVGLRTVASSAIQTRPTSNQATPAAIARRASAHLRAAGVRILDNLKRLLGCDADDTDLRRALLDLDVRALA